uniref:Uncharacterized protein n=1 Tax=Setaria digitata TaxID=48799 RepID=A0A915PY62_9BILA
MLILAKIWDEPSEEVPGSFKWSARLGPAFCAPLCLSAFFTPTPLRNIAFWVAFVSILCCVCVHTAHQRNNRYLLIPFVLLKLLLFVFLSLVSFYVMTKHMPPPLIDHLKDIDELFDSYLHFTFVAMFNGFLTAQCILFMYLALTIVYDIDYVRHFDAERNIRQQIEEEEENDELEE